MVIAYQYDTKFIYNGVTKEALVIVSDTINPRLLGRAFLGPVRFQANEITKRFIKDVYISLIKLRLNSAKHLVINL